MRTRRGRARSGRAGLRPRACRRASAISSAFPTARPSGWSMSVSSQTTSRPAQPAELDHGPGQLAGLVERLHEGAVADLDVEHDRVRPAGDLLGHDRRGDQRDDVDGRGYVPERVELLVGGDQVGGLADDREPDLADLAEERRRRRARCGSRGSTRACRASRPCGRGRGRSSSRTARRRRRRSGRARARPCRRRRRSSACRRPCARAARGRSSRRSRTIASVSACVSAAVRPWK